MKNFIFEAVIFDFDGVILDSEPLHYAACCEVIKEIGLELLYKEYIEQYIGLSDKEMFPKLLANKGYACSQDAANVLINKKIEIYTDTINNHPELPFIFGMYRYISYIKESKKKIAICSGSTRKEVISVLNKFNGGHLLSYFNTIVTAEDVKYGKPSPEGYLLAAKCLGTSPSQCLAIEDSPLGVDAAKKAGMQVIALQTTYDKQRLNKADLIVDSFMDLL